MSTSQARNRFRRQLHDIEFDLLLQHVPRSAAEVQKELLPLAAEVGEQARVQVLSLSRLAACSEAGLRQDYIDDYGCGGVHRYQGKAGAIVYCLSAETFPDHVNNLYLVIPPGPAGSRGGRTLFDAGSQFDRSQQDIDRARRVLSRIYGEGDVLSAVRDVVISHGHIDHFGGAGEWQKQGARIHVHPFDRRVLARFSERVVETAVYLRAFLLRAGCAPGLAEDLLAMNSMAKRMFQSIPVDRELCDGESVNGCRVYHVPGHCPGQVMMQVDNILLTADHLLSRTTPHQSPESITPWTGLDHYLLSLRRTLDLIQREDIDLGLGGHEDAMEDPAERVMEVEEFHKQRLGQVLEACATEQTISEVSAALFGEQTGYGRLLALEEAAAHVEYLARRGQLRIANIEDLMKQEHAAVRYTAG